MKYTGLKNRMFRLYWVFFSGK